MLDKIDQITAKAAEVSGDQAISKLKTEIDQLLVNNPANIKLLATRALLHTKQQKFGLAINDYRSMLLVDPENKMAKASIEQLQSILKYCNTDIFENPNTNFDPWLD